MSCSVLLALAAIFFGGCREGVVDEVDEAPVPTFARDIGPLFHRSCAPCHLTDGAGPFPLTSHEEVARRARQVAQVVESGFMPPWLPSGESASFKGDRSLSRDEVALVRRWVENGTPKGERETPVPPVVAPSWPLGPPDEIFSMDEHLEIPAEGDGLLHTVVFPVDFGEPKALSAIQFQAGNARALHGVGFLFDESGYALGADARSPGPGYADMGGAGMNMVGMLGGWVPGARAVRLPQGYGFRLPARGSISAQLHLNTTGRPEKEKSRVGLYFTTTPLQKSVTTVVMGSLCVDIPPGESRYVVTSDFVCPVDAQLVGLHPKARYLCSSIRVTATEAGGSTSELLDIPDYDFNWVEPYWYGEPRSLSAGTRLTLTYIYDNTAKNTRNPHDPPKRVGLGRKADDEMAFLLLYMAPDNENDYPALEKAHRDGFSSRVQVRDRWREEK